MRTKLCLLILLGLLSNTGKTQNIFVGPEFGTNAIHLGNDTLVKTVGLGWYGGANFEYKFTDWLSVRSGIFFNQTHQNYSSQDTTEFDAFGLDTLLEGIADLLTYSSTRGHQTQYYFQIPVMASFNWKGLGIYGGPYFGYNFAATTKEEVIERSPWVEIINWEAIDPSGTITVFFPPAYDRDITKKTGTSDFNAFDFGFKFGLRYQLEHFGINFAYSIAMLDYRSSPSGDPMKHQYFQGSVNYLFGLGKKKDKSKPRE